MYEKNLNEVVRLRLSENDMEFLKELSNKRCCSVSEVIRSILGEYRRSLETIDLLKDAIQMANSVKKGDKLSNGDTKTDIND